MIFDNCGRVRETGNIVRTKSVEADAGCSVQYEGMP